MNKEAEKIMNRFNGFTDDVRFLMLCHRSKEGGKNRDRKQIKYITKNKDEFYNVLVEFLEIIKKSDKPYRIYSSVNKRDINKAIRCFKTNQLEADYQNTENRDNFYYDIKNRWISSLMRPSSRAETNFIIDLDHKEPEALKAILERLCKITRSFFKYKTKNGWHIVSVPFNPALIDGVYEAEVKKDGLLLLKY